MKNTENMPETFEELTDLMTIATARAMGSLDLKADAKILCALVSAGMMTELHGHISGTDPFSEEELERAQIAGALTSKVTNKEITYEDLKNYIG